MAARRSRGRTIDIEFYINSPRAGGEIGQQHGAVHFRNGFHADGVLKRRRLWTALMNVHQTAQRLRILLGA
jgi:hypothetical protein